MRNKMLRHTLAVLVLTALPMASFALVSVGISVNVAPPELPVYVQPPCPAVGYIWTPGYWAYGDDDYYWVPGTWVMAPEPGLLWTPGYWGWGGSAYFWHAGYWGPHVGFYGGVNYGYGYTGVGFEGGYWRGQSFYYNRSVANLGRMHVTHVYNKTVINNVTVNRVSYNGGRGGVNSRPTARDLRAERDHHVEFTPTQRQHEHMASTNHDLRASVNNGRPRIAATERPAVFSGRGVVAARAAGGPVHREDVHANRMDRPASASGNAGRGAALPGHGGLDRGGPGHVAEMRGDRPPGREAAGTARGPEVHSAQTRIDRNDRPPMAHGAAEHTPSHSAMTPHSETAPQHAAMTPRPEMAPHAMTSRPEMAPRAMTSRPEMAPRAMTPRPEIAPHAMTPRPEMAPRAMTSRPEMAPRAMTPRPEMAPRAMTPRSEMPPRTSAAPRPQNAPAPQGRGQPQGRGDRNDHGHR